MRNLADAVLAFAALGLTEAVIKPVARAVVDRGLRKALPFVYERLDHEMPMLLRTTPATMAGEIGAAIEQVTGRPATARQIEQVAQLYDPLRAVLRNVK